MITFKQFTVKIGLDDEEYSRQASHYVMNFDVDDSWEPLMKIDGNRVLMLDTKVDK